MHRTTIGASAHPTRLLHTMLRTSDLDRSLEFYCNKLGMRELRRENYPDGEFTLAYIGYEEEADNSVIVLTHNVGEAAYSHGTRFGHIALAVSDLAATCERLKSKGVKILRPPGPMTHASIKGERDVIAFVEDPDGYRVELIEINMGNDEKSTQKLAL